jgi:hypothetical protein
VLPEGRERDVARDLSGVFREFQPDFVLAGLSGVGRGVDEVAIDLAHRYGVPSGAIQDYWGYLGPWGATRYPGTYFVLDARAAELTAGRAPAGTRVVITGSPKHEAYRGQLGTWIPHRAGSRKAKRPSVVYFMQPRTVPEVMRNLEVFVKAIGDTGVPVDFSVRLHPADADGAFLSQLSLPDGKPLRVLSARGPVEPILGRADLVVTMFSSVGLDHNYLQRYSRRHLGSLLYLTVGTSLRRFMRALIGVTAVPGAEEGMGRQFSSGAGLVDWLQATLTTRDERRQYARNVRLALGGTVSPIDQIATFLERIHLDGSEQRNRS